MPGLLAIHTATRDFAPWEACCAALCYDPQEQRTTKTLGSNLLSVATRGNLADSEGWHEQGDRYAAVVGLVADHAERTGLTPASLIQSFLLDDPDPHHLAQLRGSFAAAVARLDGFVVVTDGYATHPLYLWEGPQGTVVTSQLKVLLQAPGFTPQWDLQAVSSHLQLGYVTGARTLLAGVTVVPPGSRIEIGEHGVVCTRYQQIEFRRDPHPDWDRQLEELGTLLHQATARQFVAGVSIGVPLSGGLDSRALLGACPRPADVPSFTFGTPRSRDVRCGAAIARRLGSRHEVLEIDPAALDRLLAHGVWLSEGHLGATHFHILPHTPAFRQQVPVVLDGIAGDALLGGKYVKEAWLHQQIDSTAALAVWDYACDGLQGAALRAANHGDLQDEVHAAVAEDFRARFCASPGRSPADKVMDFMLHDRTRRFIGSGAQLMRWKVDVLMPFYDADLVQAIARLPHAWRKRDWFYTRLLAQAMPKAAAAAWQKTGLPVGLPYRVSWLAMAGHKAAETVFRRLGLGTPFPNREFSDYATWLRGPLRGMLDRVLLSERCLARGLVSPDFIRETVQTHLQGTGNHTQTLGTLLTLETFGRLFIDGDAPPTLA